jgi:hypothetical protein
LVKKNKNIEIISKMAKRKWADLNAKSSFSTKFKLG